MFVPPPRGLLRASRRLPSSPRAFSTARPKKQRGFMAPSQSTLLGASSVLFGGGLFYILYTNDYVQPLPPTRLRSDLVAERRKREIVQEATEREAAKNVQILDTLPDSDPQATDPAADCSAWGKFTSGFSTYTSFTDSFTEIKWASISDSITDFIVPEWARGLPENISKLQRQLSTTPGSLAEEIWQEAHDPNANPEILRRAGVRVSDDLCDEEKEFVRRRREVTRVALASYLGLPHEEVHPNDVPTIAMVGSGGGLRACVAGAGSMLASSEAGLWDCVTYTAGVSGSCWLQTIFNSSIGGRRLDRVVSHLKSRLGVHIAYPPAAFSSLNSAPTNKFLLKGVVEKLRGDPEAEFGLVDVFGLILAARLLVPKGELGVEDKDLKISNQQEYIKHGEAPLPIYTAVRHEIPIIDESSEAEKLTGSPSESTKEKAKQEAWFQWFEITPYEFFCEEFSAGIPTWALGRRFRGGTDVSLGEANSMPVPELRLPLLLGIFGSAFCATLSHYYREVKPLLKGLTGFGSIDEMIEGRDEDLTKVHPIKPASIPNFAFEMDDMLGPETPPEIYKCEHLQLMDAGMSNNLPIYPLLRPGRDVDVLIAFDASADIKVDNWLSVADGYAKQRGIKGWPVGIGWPKGSDTAETTAKQLDEAQASTAHDAEEKIKEAKADQEDHRTKEPQSGKNEPDADGHTRRDEDPNDLGYCTVWVGTTEEREHTDESSLPQSKAEAEDWQLMQPDAGIAVVYFPFLSNPKVEGVDPAKSPYMSTWNFIYTPEDVEKVVDLARANFEEGREKTRRTIRAVYERKKRIRLERERAEMSERFRRKVRLGLVGKKGEGDHFS
ncbi:MAG: hypothetical protein M1818_000493 [Claussenomyces sp. TS43310]|nr:MAG: hypothetical protein M1818_000493 [Claussenomyces sp. TS43310]